MNRKKAREYSERVERVEKLKVCIKAIHQGKFTVSCDSKFGMGFLGDDKDMGITVSDWNNITNIILARIESEIKEEESAIAEIENA